MINRLKELTKNEKGLLVFVLFMVFVIISFLFQQRKENSFYNNYKLAIGKALKIENGGKTKRYIKYKFYVNGEIVVTSDPLEAGWPVHVRDGNVIVGGYYPVEYDSKNPDNAKIVIRDKPYTAKQLIASGTIIQGLVNNAFLVSDEYVDLKISYSYKKGDFNFRTRLHKDSLPCGNQASCIGKSIQLKINKFYPELNDLYFKSYDRRHLLVKNGFK